MMKTPAALTDFLRDLPKEPTPEDIAFSLQNRGYVRVMQGPRIIHSYDEFDNTSSVPLTLALTPRGRSAIEQPAAAKKANTVLEPGRYKFHRPLIRRLL
jgi:hypothetical protein